MLLPVIFFTGLSETLKGLAEYCSGNFYMQLCVYVVFFAVTYDLLFMPFDFYGDFVLELRHGLSNQTVRGWVREYLKKAGLSLVLFLAAIEGLYFFLRQWPNWWWAAATAGWLVLTVLLNAIVPVLIIPLFYKCTPAAEGGLKERLLKLGEKCRVEVKDVFTIHLSSETRKANAAVAGLGRTRRILLGDTLAEQYSDDEIEAIFAHELGHIKLGHKRKIIVFGTIVSLVVFYVTSLLLGGAAGVLGFDEIYDIAGFPILMLLLTLVGLVLMPIQSGYMRHLEKQADVFAVKHAKDPHSLGSALEKLAEQNLADVSPSRLEEVLVHEHPAISKRLAYIAAAAERTA